MSKNIFLFSFLGISILNLLINGFNDSVFYISILMLFIIINLIFTFTSSDKNEFFLPKEKQNIKLNFIIAFFLSLISTIIFFTNLNNNTIQNLLNSLIYFLSNFLILFPYEISKKYRKKTLLNNDNYYQLACTKTIILLDEQTDITLKKYLKIFHRAGINIIINNKIKLSTNLSKYFIKTSMKDLNNKNVNSNLQITDAIDLPKIERISKNNEIICCQKFSDLKNVLKKIHISRNIFNDLKRTIIYRNIFSISIVISNILMPLLGFPICFSSKQLVLISFILYLFVEFFFLYLPHDKKIMNKIPILKKDSIYNKENKIFSFMQILNIVFAVTISYMASLVNELSYEMSVSILITTYLFTIFFITFQNISDNATIFNILLNLKNKVALSFIVIIFLLTIFISKIPYLSLKNINPNNYIRCIILALVFVLWFDITKLARFTTVRKKDKDDKNN